MQSRQWLYGCWGGSLERDRWELRDLPPAEALEILEASFPERLQVRIEAYTAWRETYPRNRRVLRAVDALLAERTGRLGRF